MTELLNVLGYNRLNARPPKLSAEQQTVMDFIRTSTEPVTHPMLVALLKVHTKAVLPIIRPLLAYGMIERVTLRSGPTSTRTMIYTIKSET